MKKYKFEMHFHTDETSPCGKVPAKEGVEIFQKAGYDGIVITDHFSKSVFGDEKEDWEDIAEAFLKGYQVAKESAKERGMKILLGMEIRFPYDENDFLLYGIDEKFVYRHPWIYMKELKDLFEISKKENFLIVQAHPFRNHCTLAPLEFLHGIEVFNGNPRQDSNNQKAERTAEENGLLKLCGSDFHQYEDVSGHYYELSEIPRNESELAEMIRIKGEL